MTNEDPAMTPTEPPIPAPVPDRRFTWASVLLIAALALPSALQSPWPYPTNYHGSLTAWFDLMARNMVESGFRETRFAPVINPNPAKYPDFRWYLTHPPLDVILRAGLVKAFGPHEWVIRLQGIFGCFAGALLLASIGRRLGLSPAASTAAAAGMIAMPLFPRLAQLSMHHPMTLFCALLAARLWLAAGGRRPRAAALALFLALAAGMEFDWPGYFAPLLLWIAELAGKRRRLLVIGIPLAVLFAAGAFFVQVEFFVRPERGFLALLRSATQVPGAATSAASPLELVWMHQRQAFGIFGLSLMGTGLVLAAFSVRRRRFLSAWALLAAFGGLHLAVFPGKAPYHDFWGCYLLPLAGFSAGLFVELVLAPLLRRLDGGRPWLVAGLSVGIAAAMLILAPKDVTAHEDGANLRSKAETIRALVPPEDRGLLLSNFELSEAQTWVLAAYTRINMLARRDLRAVDLPAFREELRTLFSHVRGRRVLFFLTEDPAHPEAVAELARALNAAGRPWARAPGVIDLTDWLWSEAALQGR